MWNLPKAESVLSVSVSGIKNVDSKLVGGGAQL